MAQPDETTAPIYTELEYEVDPTIGNFGPAHRIDDLSGMDFSAYELYRGSIMEMFTVEGMHKGLLAVVLVRRDGDKLFAIRIEASVKGVGLCEALGLEHRPFSIKREMPPPMPLNSKRVP